MSSESVPATMADTFHPMVPYKRRSPDTPYRNVSHELADRLNIDVDTLGLATGSKDSYSLNSPHSSASSPSGGTKVIGEPFGIARSVTSRTSFTGSRVNAGQGLRGLFDVGSNDPQHQRN